MDRKSIDTLIEAHFFGPSNFEPETQKMGITHEMLDDHRSDDANARIIAQARAVVRGVVRPRQRYFLDTLSITGDAYLIPANRRMDWDAYDTEAEQSSDPPPIPDYAVPVATISYLEFENPEEVFK